VLVMHSFMNRETVMVTHFETVPASNVFNFILTALQMNLTQIVCETFRMNPACSCPIQNTVNLRHLNSYMLCGVSLAHTLNRHNCK
jgi:hypothetical protein